MAAKKKSSTRIVNKPKKDDIIKLDDTTLSFDDVLKQIADNSKPKKKD